MYCIAATFVQPDATWSEGPSCRRPPVQQGALVPHVEHTASCPCLQAKRDGFARKRLRAQLRASSFL